MKLSYEVRCCCAFLLLLFAHTHFCHVHIDSPTTTTTAPTLDDNYINFRGSVLVTQTAKDSTDRLTLKGEFPVTVGTKLDSNVSVITVNASTRFQRIEGFGGAFTEAGMYVLSKLPQDMQDTVLNSYFGPDGLGYSLCRVHINSCDFSLASYSYADTVDDFTLSSFNMSHDTLYLLPNILRASNISALSGRSLRIFGTPWSPPAWMKGSNNMTGSSQPCLKSSEYAPVWAEYLSRWATEYKANGVNVWGMTVQNEPEFAAPWEACVFTAEQERDFVRDHLGPVLRRDHPELNLMIYDHNKDNIFNWTQVVYSDSEAAQYVWGTAFHWYSGPQFENLASAHNYAPSKHLLASEACNCPGVLLDDWSRGESYGNDILGDLNNWATGWVDWNMVLDERGGPNHVNNFCDSPIIADLQQVKLNFQPPFYYMGHFSKFLTPGSTRISSTVSSQELQVTAFLTPDEAKIVLIVLNQTPNAIKYQLVVPVSDLIEHDDGLEEDEENRVAFVKHEVPAHGIQTLVYNVN